MRKSPPKTILFEQLLKASKERLQEDDNVFIIEDNLLPAFYEMFELSHEEMMRFPGLKLFIQNHIIQAVKDGELEMVSGRNLQYVLNKSVDGVPIGDVHVREGVKYLLLEGVLLPNEDELVAYVKNLRSPDKPKIDPGYTRRRVTEVVKVEREKKPIQLKNYSEKAVVLVGDTTRYKDILSKNKLFIWNSHLKGGAGWIASKKSINRVIQSLDKAGIPYEDMTD